jgi:hypothetical protein
VIEAIEIAWPVTGEVQVFRDVTPDRVYKIVEGEANLAEVPVRTFKF